MLIEQAPHQIKNVPEFRLVTPVALLENPSPNSPLDLLKIKDITADTPPFTIRGHHIEWFHRALTTQPSKLAARLRKSVVEANLGEEYITDVLGSTQEEGNRFEKYARDLFSTFRQLPPDYPIKLVTGQEDEICKGCIQGQHCSLKEINLTGETREAISADGHSLNAFYEHARNLRLEGRLRLVFDMTEFSDRGPFVVRSILTTAETAKKIMSDPKSFTKSQRPGIFTREYSTQ